MQEADLGDFIPLGGNTGEPKVGSPQVIIRGLEGKPRKFDPTKLSYFKGQGYIQASSEHDAAHGEWNHLEIYVLGNNAVHLVNGHIVMVVEDAHTHDGKPLTKGEIQIQSEAAECYYKELVLSPISEFPEKIQQNVRFKDETPSIGISKKLFNGKNFEGWYLRTRNSEKEPAEKVFSINDQQHIHVFGEGYTDGHGLDTGENFSHGMAYTNQEFSHYILNFEYKWGEKRTNNFSAFQYDAGVYYHVYNDNIWPGGLEYQIRFDHRSNKNHTGDFWASGKCRFDWNSTEEKGHYTPQSEGGTTQPQR